MHHRHDEVLARHDLQSPRPPHRAIRRRQRVSRVNLGVVRKLQNSVAIGGELRNGLPKMHSNFTSFGRNAV